MTNQHPSLPWNFMTHGFLDLSAFPEAVMVNYRAVPHRVPFTGGASFEVENAHFAA